MTIGQNDVRICVCVTSHFHTNEAVVGRWGFSSIYLCFGNRKFRKKLNDIWAAVNNDVCAHSWGDLPIILTRDCVIRDNYWRITPLVTTNIVINGSPYITWGNRAKLPSSRWRRRGRSLREVFACSRLYATTDLSQICNRVTRWHGTSCSKTTNLYPFRFCTIISERFAARRR